MALPKTRLALHRIEDILVQSAEDALVHSVPPAATIIAKHPGTQAKSSKKLCLFATFDPQGRIDPYVQSYASHLKDCGFDVILISTSKTLDPSDLAAVRKFCRFVIHRRNIGFDFASWKVALDLVNDWSGYDELLLANDSVFGPFRDLNNIFAEIRGSPEAICGFTDSWERSVYHLQSYFLHFKRSAVTSPAFRKFWSGVRLRASKFRTILNYEMGLSQHFLRDGFKIKALFPVHDVKERVLALGPNFQYQEMLRSQSFNSTLFAWDVLITEFKYPFIKTEMLTTNRFESRAVEHWTELLPTGSEERIELAKAYLARLDKQPYGMLPRIRDIPGHLLDLTYTSVRR